MDIYNSERSDECIDFTMINTVYSITFRNNTSILNFGGGIQRKVNPWCIVEVKSKNFPTIFKKIEKNKNK
ncbi:Uncharacterized protein FWK35_00012698 [Aphis craccivora]|uniref:Uncharacterized protein n=1 Tax=Aphis craccivora TaxID=307492 RepID=A0A6G0YLN6_APHCR|nr:Uncharacterized protein FWK35_00012698 [Aphis craccivora]